MIKRLFIIILAVLIISPAAGAMQVAGVTLPDGLTAGKDKLILNGAGIRKKFFFKIYAGGLYLKQKNTDPDQIVNDDAPMAVRMHFIYDGVAAKKLIHGWNEGFDKATDGNIASIKTGIDKFNSFFTEEAKKNDVYDIIYVPNQGTSVYMKGKLKGTIGGLDFKKYLFSIWLGKKPADGNLKKGMLGK